jgi:hypothetical protein
MRFKKATTQYPDGIRSSSSLLSDWRRHSHWTTPPGHSDKFFTHLVFIESSPDRQPLRVRVGAKKFSLVSPVRRRLRLQRVVQRQSWDRFVRMYLFFVRIRVARFFLVQHTKTGKIKLYQITIKYTK